MKRFCYQSFLFCVSVVLGISVCSLGYCQKATSGTFRLKYTIVERDVRSDSMRRWRLAFEMQQINAEKERGDVTSEEYNAKVENWKKYWTEVIKDKQYQVDLMVTSAGILQVSTSPTIENGKQKPGTEDRHIWLFNMRENKTLSAYLPKVQGKAKVAHIDHGFVSSEAYPTFILPGGDFVTLPGCKPTSGDTQKFVESYCISTGSVVREPSEEKGTIPLSKALCRYSEDGIPQEIQFVLPPDNEVIERWIFSDSGKVGGIILPRRIRKIEYVGASYTGKEVFYPSKEFDMKLQSVDSAVNPKLMNFDSWKQENVLLHDRKTGKSESFGSAEQSNPKESQGWESRSGVVSLFLLIAGSSYWLWKTLRSRKRE